MKRDYSEAIKKKILEDKVVILKPSPRGGKMVTSPTHINYFMADGASENFVIMLDKGGVNRIDVFRNDEEKAFFENELGKNMNIHDDEGYLANLSVKITKDPYLMERGKSFDLSTPMGNLQWRILCTNNTIAPSWDERYERDYKWAFVDKENEHKKEVEEFSKEQKAFMAGGVLSSGEDKVRNFLRVYFADNKKQNKVGSDMDKDWLVGEMYKVIKEDIDLFLASYDNPLYEDKVFLFKAFDAGGIQKTGTDEYVISGEEQTYTFSELAKELNGMAEDQTDIYMKLVALIKKA